MKWAIDKVVDWKNRIQPQNRTLINEFSDIILPISFVKLDIIVPKGGHFMVLNRSEEINEILSKIFQNL